ncbi:MAG: hemerythrin domain-containing protein [Sorangiineae bacterium]|nr:hemerythrin domain-containing protein [Polyangiaceae bacterium]MEB2323224.1 hemerythrin domain-containing protein [Sorangiineae bacterium]
MKRITEYLYDEHQRLHALLEAADTEPVDLDAYASFRAILLRHIGIEEKILFPAVKRALGRPLEAAPILRIEHAALTSLMVSTPDRALIAEVRGLLHRHDEREEREGGIYAECDVVLGDESFALHEGARTQREVPVSKYYDGPEAYRTAAAALAAAERIAAARRQRKPG